MMGECAVRCVLYMQVAVMARTGSGSESSGRVKSNVHLSVEGKV